MMRQLLNKNLKGLGLAVLLLLAGNLCAQELPRYLFRDGKMIIEIGRNTRSTALDSFINKFDLSDLALKEFLKDNNADSLRKLGWKIERNNELGLTISKGFDALEKINNPADKILYTEKHLSIADRFQATGKGIVFGYNRFRNKFPFAVRDSFVRFFLKGNIKAKTVYLAGSFNNWAPGTTAMQRVDSGWIIDLALSPGKYWYKFITDGHWIIDPDNALFENDGEGNTNSVYYRTNTVFRARGFTEAKNAFLAGSFNNWRERDLRMMPTGTGWELPVYLAPGTHTYKFVIDGRWYADADNTLKLPDGHGAYNSVIIYGKPQVFRLGGYEKAGRVELVGSFNNWKEGELFMQKAAGGWELPYVLGPGNHEYRFKVDGKWITDPANPVRTGNDGNSFIFIEPNYSFRLKGFPAASEVFLAGDFNHWGRSFRMKREGDEWVFSLHLPPGKHRYKFIVDGKWILDPSNKLWEQNEFKTGNSILWLK